MTPLPPQPLDILAHGCRYRLQIRPGHDRRQVLQPDRLAPALDAPLVVPLPGSREARFEQVVTGQCPESIRQFPIPQPQQPLHRRRQVVVDEAPGHAAQVRERTHMAVQKARLVAAVVKVDEVPPRVHQPYQELPNPAPDAPLVNQHLEEVNLGLVPGAVDQRNENFRQPPPSLRQVPPHRPLANPDALLEQLPVQPRRRQPMLARQSRPPLIEQRLDPRGHRPQYRLRTWRQLFPPWLRLD